MAAFGGGSPPRRGNGQMPQLVGYGQGAQPNQQMNQQQMNQQIVAQAYQQSLMATPVTLPAYTQQAAPQPAPPPYVVEQGSPLQYAQEQPPTYQQQAPPYVQQQPQLYAQQQQPQLYAQQQDQPPAYPDQQPRQLYTQQDWQAMGGADAYPAYQPVASKGFRGKVSALGRTIRSNVGRIRSAQITQPTDDEVQQSCFPPGSRLLQRVTQPAVRGTGYTQLRDDSYPATDGLHIDDEDVQSNYYQGQLRFRDPNDSQNDRVRSDSPVLGAPGYNMPGYNTRL